MIHIQTQCHCGNIQLALHTAKDPVELPLRRCLCSFCRSRGSIYTSDRDGELAIIVERIEDVSEYRNPHSISAHTMFFLVCRTCGAAPAAISELDGKDHAVLNVSGGTEPSLADNPVADLAQEGEDLAGRLDRRRRTWISRVTRTDRP